MSECDNGEKGKIIVEWDFESPRETATVNLSTSERYIVVERRYKKRVFSSEVFKTAEPYLSGGIWDDESVFWEDSVGNFNIQRDDLIRVWDCRLEDEGYTKDEEAEESVEVINFVKFIREQPPGSHITIEGF